MTWFHGVPDRVTIARGLDFLTASEALWESDPGEVDPWQERPPNDFGATAVLMMARLQLDQMVEVLDRPPLSSGDGRLGSALRRITIVEDGHNTDGAEDPGNDLACVEEALHLRQSLQGSVEVDHGFAPDGSISITVGPDIPESAALGLRGSEEGEMNDTTVQVFAAAVEATRAAVRIVTALEAADGTTISRRSYP